MLPQERPALFRVAGIAGQIDGRTLQQEVIIAIVRIVAIAAGHAAKAQWMTAGFLAVRAFSHMAGEASLLLRQGIENPVAFGVDLMAGCTGNIFTFVCTAGPTQLPPGFMTAQAYLVLFGCRCLGIEAKGNRRNTFIAPALGACMFLAGPVAGFTLKIRKRCARVGP